MWTVVALSGVTCGGKSTLAKKLSNELKHCEVLNQDKYFYPDDSPNHVKVDNIDHNNYDNLGCLDMEKMFKDVKDILSTEVSIKNSTERPVLVLDGFIILNYKPIADLCHLKYQIYLDKDECYRRRILRTYLPPDCPGYFEFCAWPEYLKYNEEVKSMKDVTFLDGTATDSLEKILKDIRAQF